MKCYIKSSTNVTSAKELLFDLIYDYCKETCGISPSFAKPLTRKGYYEEFDRRFAESVYDAIAHYLGRDFDIGMQEVNIISEAILEKAESDSYWAYGKPEQCDDLIDEWELPVLGE